MTSLTHSDMFYLGKQARQSPQDDPTTSVSHVHAHQQRAPKNNYDYAPPPQNHNAISDPNVIAHQAHQVPGGDAYSAADAGAQNRGAQAGNVAAHAAGQNQKMGKKKVDKDEIERLVREEAESKSKLPRYPGLERWSLVEKMGDGAFSNVYRARDTATENNVGEVAIKVVRKFEMNSSQVSISGSMIFPDILYFTLSLRSFANTGGR